MTYTLMMAPIDILAWSMVVLSIQPLTMHMHTMKLPHYKEF